jgi:hypothetical protein
LIYYFTYYLIYLFKLWRLLHDRINPTVETLRKQPQTGKLKLKRVQRCKTTTSLPPMGAPSWCLNREALERFNRPTNNIPVYDYDTDEDIQEHDYSGHDTDNEDKNRANSNKKKRKNKKKSKQKKGKKHKKNKN